MNPIYAILQAALGPILSIIDKAVPDKALALKLKAELSAQMLASDGASMQAASNIIVAEAKGESWMQRNWRPLTMLSFVFIIVNNYVLAPYSTLFGIVIPTLAIPPGMWGLLQLGIGGYIASRGAEKIATTIAPAVAMKRRPAPTENDLIRSLNNNNNGGGR